VTNPPAKILVIRGGAIGDFILTLPVLAALRTAFPAVQREVLGYAHIARLAETGGLVDGVRSIEAGALASFFARGGSLTDELQNYFSGFAIILSYLYDPDEIFRENVARCSKAQFIQGPHRPDDGSGRHATEVLLQPLERLAIFDADPTPRLAPPAAPPASFHLPLALHPGSGSPRKNWPEARWAALIERLSVVPGQRLLVVGGEAEGDRLRRLAAQARCPTELAASLPLPTLAGRLAECRFFIGHDSGITHLAAAVGLEGVALWGETPEQIWRPRSDRMEILRGGPGLEQLSVEAVFAACTRHLPPPAHPE
jgi:heptosyltransferase-2